MPLPSLAQRAVILDSQCQVLVDLGGRARLGLEFELMLGAGQVTLERGIEDQLQAGNAALEDGRQLERARALAERRSRRLILEAEPEPHRQPPFLGSAKPRAQPPAGVADAEARYLSRQQIARHFPVVGDTAGQLARKSHLTLGGCDGAIEDPRPAARVVEVSFELPFTAK